MKNVFQIRALYNALSVADQAILESKACKAELTPTEWLSLIDRLAAFERRAHRARGSACACFWLSLILAFATACIGAGMQNPWPLAVTAIAGIAGFGFFLPRWLWLRSIDLGEALHAYVAPLLAILREDTKPTGKLKCAFDFNHCDSSEKAVSVVDVPKHRLRAGTRRRTNRLFRNAWLSVEGTLINGSKLKFEVTDFGTIAKISKVKKTKIKAKIKRVSRVTLRPGPGSAVAPGAPPDGVAVITRADGSKAIRSLRTESFNLGFSLKKAPAPNLAIFTALTGQALQRTTPVAGR